MTPATQIGEWVRGLGSPAARVKYGSSKALRRASVENPKLVYPYFDTFSRLLDGDNHILRWNAARILGSLASVDSEGRIEKLFRRLFAAITGHEMIAAANTMQAGADIALAKPHLAGRIAREIMKVEIAEYQRPECANVGLGHAIESLLRFYPLIGQKRPVIEFVKRQLDNPRPATRRKAEHFLKSLRNMPDPRRADTPRPSAPNC